MAPIDTSDWATYTSRRYGFTIGHPPDWTVEPSQFDWIMVADANQWDSRSLEILVSADSDLAVTAWSTRADTPETWDGLQAWIEQFCLLAEPGCILPPEQTVKLCHEGRDCHPGWLVALSWAAGGDHFYGFFTGGSHRGRIVVVGVNRPDDHSTLIPYGGSRRLLEAFLSTMDVCPTVLPDQNDCP